MMRLIRKRNRLIVFGLSAAIFCCVVAFFLLPSTEKKEPADHEQDGVSDIPREIEQRKSTEMLPYETKQRKSTEMLPYETKQRKSAEILPLRPAVDEERRSLVQRQRFLESLNDRSQDLPPYNTGQTLQPERIREETERLLESKIEELEAKIPDKQNDDRLLPQLEAALSHIKKIQRMLEEYSPDKLKEMRSPP